MVATETAKECETKQRRILIADDQKDVLDALQLLLKGRGYGLETASTPADLLAALAQREFDLVLMDLNYARDTTSGEEGLDVLGHLREMRSEERRVGKEDRSGGEPEQEQRESR